MTTRVLPTIERSSTFHAMGTEVLVIVAAFDDDPATEAAIATAIGRVQDLFARQEARFSRFVDGSELSRMNRERGSVHPSDDLWEVLLRARFAWQWSHGAFEPAVLPALERAGYDRSFEQIDNPVLTPQAAASGTFDDVHFTESAHGRGVTLVNGVRLDLGGIVKGWTVDRAIALLTAFPGSLVDAGGDIRAAGDCTDGGGWPVALEVPIGTLPGEWAVWIRDGAVTTSGKYRRRWNVAGGTHAHHFIDPSNGAPSLTDVTAVTVVGATAEASEITAKVALLAGSDKAIAVIEGQPDAQGMIYTDDGRWRCTPGWMMTPVEPVGVDREGNQG